MKVFKILMGTAAALMLVALLAPQAAAQCVPAASFSNEGAVAEAQEVFVGVSVACQGSATGAVDPIVEDAGNAIGRFWSFADSNQFNNFGANACPVSGWWDSVMMGGARQVTGALNSDGCCVGTSCGGGLCPGDSIQLAFLVEDYGVGGPGVATDAAFWYSRVDRGNSLNGIVWDLGRVGASNDLCHEMQKYPALEVSGSSRLPGNVLSAQTFYVDIKPADIAHTAIGAGNADSPATASVVSYDVCLHQGSGDPGRDRDAYNLGCSDQIPMVDGGIAALDSVPVNVDCTAADTAGEDIFAAVGLTFAGGGRAVPSILVGPVTALECDPTHVDSKPNLQRRDNNIRSKRSRSSRGAGR